MTVTLFSGVVLAVFAIVIAWQVHKGHKCGLVDALIHLAVLVGSLFGSIAISRLWAKSLSEALTDVVAETEFYRVLSTWISSVDVLIGLAMQMIFGFLLYLPVFFLLTGVAKLILRIIRRYNRKKHPETDAQSYTDENAPDYLKNTHRAGAWVGALSGIVLSIVLLTPIVGFITVADHTVTFCEKYGIVMETDRKTAKELHGYSQDIACRVIRCCGADMIVNLTTQAELDGQKTTLYREMETVNRFDLELLQNTLLRMDSLTERDLRALDEQLESIDDSLLLKAMAAETLSSAASSWSQGGAFMGMPRPNFGNAKLFDPVIKGILSVCQHTTMDTVVSDLRALLDMAHYFCQMKPMIAAGNYTAVLQELASGGIGQQFQTDIYQNLTAELMDEAMRSLALRSLLIEIENRGKYSAQMYQDLAQQLATSINSIQNSPQSVQNATMNAHVKKYFRTMGVTLPGAVSEELSEKILNQFSGKGEVDAEMVKAHFEEMVTSLGVIKK